MWAQIVKKGLNKKTTKGLKKTTKGHKKTTKGKGGGQGQGQKCSPVWKTGRWPTGRTVFQNGRNPVPEEIDIKYGRQTNSAGIPQCVQRKTGKIAVLMGKEKSFTTRFRMFQKPNETDEEFQKRKTETENKRLGLLFCPELVDITLDPTLSREQRLEGFHKFVEENYPEDIVPRGSIYGNDLVQVLYGETEKYRRVKPGETAENVPKFCTIRGGLFLELTLDLEVVWINPGTRFKIKQSYESGMEYIITDEDFDVA